MTKCRICGKEEDTRFGVCFDCAEAESIIDEGLDMYDKGMSGDDQPAKTPMEKLQFLVKKGWNKKGK